MIAAMDAIFTRRSIRKYTFEPISKEVIDLLLKAAMSAPSAGNERPWHFVVISDRKILDAIPEFHEYSSMLMDAPVAIAVCGDLLLQKYKSQFWVQDCSAATENMLIAANAMGLGAVWLGIYPIANRVERMSKLLRLPENIITLCLVAIGHPAESKPPVERHDPSRVHKDNW
jgi:nitroreductase